jgi:hypothetical protein
MTAAADVATHIAARVVEGTPAAGEIEGPVNLTYGANCREGPERPATENQGAQGAVPDECVFVVPTGGFPDEPFRGGDPTLTPRTTPPETWPGIEKPTFDVVVRGLRKNFDRAYELALVVRQAIDKSPPAGYFESRAPNPPNYVREDEENRHIFIFTVELRRCQ